MKSIVRWVTRSIATTLLFQCFHENKKVLLRERKRHTTRRLASAPSVVLHRWKGYPCQVSTGGIPWVPPCPDLAGVPLSDKDMGPVEVLWDGDMVPPGKDMGPVEVLWDGDGVHPPPGCGLTNKLKLLPSLILRMRAVKNANYSVKLLIPFEYSFTLTYGKLSQSVIFAVTM